MIESDYISVSNLAKLRIADQVLRDCTFLGASTCESYHKSAIGAIGLLISVMETVIVEPDPEETS